VIFRVENSTESHKCGIAYEFVDPIQCVADGRLHISSRDDLGVDIL
jgi:hypothetical protein